MTQRSKKRYHGYVRMLCIKFTIQLEAVLLKIKDLQGW
jgi:hypothetical protein